MATLRSTLLTIYFLHLHFFSIVPSGQIINIHPNEERPDDQRDYGCRPGFKYETLKGTAPKCEKCGGAQFYCINGEAKEVSPGYYSVGGKWNMRTSQSKCGGNDYYCVDGKRNKAGSSQYTTGGTELTRTGVAICTQIKNCDVPETCTTATDQKCGRCKEDTTRVQTAGKPDECKFVDAGIKRDDALDKETCDAASGFNADLRKAIVVESTRSPQTIELRGWRTTGHDELYSYNADISYRGRFFPSADIGYYLCSANIRFEKFSGSVAKMMVAINKDTNEQTGLSVIRGGGSSGIFFSLTTSGTLMLKKGEFLSVMVFTVNEADYEIHSQSGFSCHQLVKPVGFHAIKDGEQFLKSGWAQVTNWRDSGKGLYSIDQALSLTDGTFKVSMGNAAYYCTARIRFDEIKAVAVNDENAIDIRVQLRVNGLMDVKNGMQVVEGNGASYNRHSLNLAGTVRLNAGQKVSVWAYSSVSVWIRPESGFSCHLLGTHRGFHASLSKDQLYGRGWTMVTGWKTFGNNELYSWKGRPVSKGYYEAPVTGFYVCAAQIQADSLSNSPSKIILGLQKKPNGHGGLFAVEGNGGSTDKRTLRVSGTIAIPRGWTVSVLIFTLKDKQWTANRQSGFSCHLLRSFIDDKCPEEQAARAMAQVFAFWNDTNSTRYIDMNATDIATLTSPMKDVDSQDETIATDGDAATRMSYQLLAVVVTLMQMMS